MACPALLESLARHVCGWAEIRQKPGQTPATEHLDAIFDSLNDPTIPESVRFVRVLFAGIGFAVGFLCGLLGLRQRWSAQQAAWGLASLSVRVARWTRANPEVPAVAALAEWAFLRGFGAGADAGATVPLTLLSVFSLGRVSERFLRRLRPRVEADWVVASGIEMGGAFARAFGIPHPSEA